MFISQFHTYLTNIVQAKLSNQLKSTQSDQNNLKYAFYKSKISSILAKKNQRLEHEKKWLDAIISKLHFE